MKYTPFEIENILKTMTVLCDTREHPGERFDQRMAAIGRPWKRTKLDFGDYSCEYTDPEGKIVSLANIVAIERKMDLTELAMCFGKERERFKREFERAEGATIYLLIENANWEAQYRGNYRSKFNPKALRANMLTWSIRYNIKIHFCTEELTGSLIGDILHYELREHLERIEE